MNSNVIHNKKMDFVREFLCNLCNFDSSICDTLITCFHEVDKNIFSSIYLCNNEKYQVLIELLDKGININSKVTTIYEYNDGSEWFIEEYIDSRKDKFILEVDVLHHIYDKKSTVCFVQEYGALREGMKELRGECFYLLSDNFSFDNLNISKLQKVKR